MMTYEELINSVPESAAPCYLGYAAIQFRNIHHDNLKLPTVVHAMYIMNGTRDGWFRRNEPTDVAYGYGIAINNVVVTGRIPQEYGSGTAYKAKMNYINHQEEPDSANIWIFVHQDTNLDDVLRYIKENSNNWYP